jgi:hypothetical protein
VLDAMARGDAGRSDAHASLDASSFDAASFDASSFDAPPLDAPPLDAPPLDVAVLDADRPDAILDADRPDAIRVDGAAFDAFADDADRLDAAPWSDVHDAGTDAGSTCSVPCESRGPCEVAVCRGTRCDHFAAGPDVVCRPSRGVCDRAERCDGVSTACPPDVLLPPGSLCMDGSGDRGSCNDDGACVASEGGTCILPGTCQIGVLVGGRCITRTPVGIPAPAGTLCSPGDGRCVLDAVCDGVGVTCPSNPTATTCTITCPEGPESSMCDGRLCRAVCPTP